MIDLTPLRPRTNARPDINAALVRCDAAARGAAAEIARVRGERAGLLMGGTSAQLDENAVALSTALTDGLRVHELIEHLKGLLANPPVPDPHALQREALEAAGRLATWWVQHGAETVKGMTLLAEAAGSIIAWRADAPPPPENVAPFQPVA